MLGRRSSCEGTKASTESTLTISLCSTCWGGDVQQTNKKPDLECFKQLKAELFTSWNKQQNKVPVLGEKDEAPAHLTSSKEPFAGLRPVWISEHFCPNILLPTASLQSIFYQSRVPSVHNIHGRNGDGLICTFHSHCSLMICSNYPN